MPNQLFPSLGGFVVFFFLKKIKWPDTTSPIYNRSYHDTIIVNLTGEGRRRQTFCDKRDNNTFRQTSLSFLKQIYL